MRSLQTRLLLAVGVLAIAAVAAVAFSARQSTRQEFERFQNIERIADLREAGGIEAALARVATALEGTCCEAARMTSAAAVLDRRQAVLAFDAGGQLRAAAGADMSGPHVRASLRDGLLEIDTMAGLATSSTGMKVAIKGGPSRSIRGAGGEPVTLVVVAMPEAEGDSPAGQFLGSVDRRLLMVTAAVAALALLATWAMTRRIVGPIVELRRATRDLAAGQLSRRVPASGADEVAELGRGFNQMAAALERQEELRRHLVHDVAHELRTPLTALRCRVETLLDGLADDPKPALRQVNEDVAHLSQLVSDLEDLARAEARELALAVGEVVVAEVCRSAIRVAGLTDDPRVRLECDAALMARADAVRLRQIVVNLLTNAERHTPSGGVITVRGMARDGAATIEVHNTGSALTPEEQHRVFDRFYRADPSRQRATGGSGLGLAIVKQLAEAQNGRVWVVSDATGVTVGVALPISAT